MGLSKFPSATAGAGDISGSGSLTNNSAVVGAGASSIKNLALAAQSLMASVSANTPAALVFAASTICARLASGDLKAVTPLELRTLLNVYFSKNDATAAPGVTNDTDEGYVPGSLWIDTTADKAYICLDNTDGAAVWTEITAAGGSGTSLWTAIPGFTATPASTSTITLTADLTAVVKKGMALKYTYNSNTYYGFAEAITSILLTVSGVTLATGGGANDLTALSYSTIPGMVKQVELMFPGAFADATSTALITEDLLLPSGLIWNLPPAHLVLIEHEIGTDDSSADTSQALINVTHAGDDVLSADSEVSETLVTSGIGIDSAKYDITQGEAIEVAVPTLATASASNDAVNLFITLTYVME